MEKDKIQVEQEHVSLVRILGKDLRGDKKVLSGLTEIKGISWTISNAICYLLKIKMDKRIQDLTSEEIGKIESFFLNSDLPSFIKNRQKDFDEGIDKHLYGPDLRLRNEFDVKRLRKVKSYRGARHAVGLPVRGQRTRSNFRKNRKKSGAVGVKKKK